MRTFLSSVCLVVLIAVPFHSAARAQSIILPIIGLGSNGSCTSGNWATAMAVSPSGVAVDSAANLYVAVGGCILKIAASTGIATVVGPQPNMQGFALDSSGNVYIAEFPEFNADPGNFVVKMLPNGTAIKIAGLGPLGYSGDGGPATSAELYQPWTVAVDSAGNVYIDDTGNNRIRKVTAATGIITTVAGDGVAGYNGDGGPATSAELNEPLGIAVDSAGNLYLAEYGNSRIRKVSAATGIITTIAGNGSLGYSGDGGPATDAALYHPQGVAVDSAGNVYISDTWNSVIREVTASTGVIHTIAGGGNGCPGETDPFGDGCPALDAALNVPLSITVDSFGNLYLADIAYYVQNDFNLIREITAQSQTAEPTFTPAGTGGVYGAPGFTEGQWVTVSDSTPDATIYCSTGNALPVPAAANLCKSPVRVNGQTTLNAVAVAPGVNPPGYNRSSEQSEIYAFTVSEVNFTNEVPSASGASMTVYLADATPDAAMYYTTDGALPVVGAADVSEYAGPIVVTKQETIKAIGVHAGYQSSTVATRSILLPAAQPVISPATSVLHAPQTVTISDATPGVTLYCILNGAPAVPCAASYQVNSPQEIAAYAQEGGFARSVLATAFYTMRVANPILSAKSGVYPNPLQVALSDATPGATIYYTTDGSTPAPGSGSTQQYANLPITVSTTETIKVIAVLSGYQTSSLEEGAYRIP